MFLTSLVAQRVYSGITTDPETPLDILVDKTAEPTSFQVAMEGVGVVSDTEEMSPFTEQKKPCAKQKKTQARPTPTRQHHLTSERFPFDALQLVIHPEGVSDNDCLPKRAPAYLFGMSGNVFVIERFTRVTFAQFGYLLVAALAQEIMPGLGLFCDEFDRVRKTIYRTGDWEYYYREPAGSVGAFATWLRDSATTKGMVNGPGNTGKKIDFGFLQGAPPVRVRDPLIVLGPEKLSEQIPLSQHADEIKIGYGKHFVRFNWAIYSGWISAITQNLRDLPQ